MFYETGTKGHGLILDPFKAIVAPRPIGWISSLSRDGIANLAPYSFFNAVSERPYYLVFGSSGRKHSLRNIEATGVFAVSLATWDLREQMNISAAAAEAGVDEFELAGLAKAPCRTIEVPRVAASPAGFECRLHRIVPLPDDEGEVGDWAVLGRVTGIHIDDHFIAEGRIDTAAMKLIARLGYSEYTTVETAWRMRRPG